MAVKQIKILRDMVYSSRPCSAGTVVNTDTDLKECKLALSSGWAAILPDEGFKFPPSPKATADKLDGAAILPDKIEKTIKKRGKKVTQKAVKSECI